MLNLIKSLFIAILTIILFVAAKEFQPKENKGEQLAKQYCSICHLYPSPELLDKETWAKYILPRMGKLMQIIPNETNDDEVFENEYLNEIKERGIIMDFSYITSKEWESIKSFYLAKAPEFLPKNEIEPAELTTLFSPNYAPFYFNPPSTTLMKMSKNSLWVADVHSATLFEVDSNFNIKQNKKIKPQAAVSICNFNENAYLTFMGSFAPTDKALGKIQVLKNKKINHNTTIIIDLRRPVHTSVNDLNGDNLPDVVVAEFGKWLGKLSIFFNKGNDVYEQKDILMQTGCIKSELYDFNKDGHLDIIALFAQGNEHISIFYNDGKGNFDWEQVLRFPPSYGSSGFRLVDFDKNGLMDIVYFNGDLADFPIASKPYQGIRLYKNKGQNQFTEERFLPFSGVYDAIVADFDLDGDLDLAAISFFVDYEHDNSNGFCFFENQNGNYIRKTFKGSENGRWIVMDAADFDDDGDLDIALGSLIMELKNQEKRVEQWTKNGLPYVILKNDTKH